VVIRDESSRFENNCCALFIITAAIIYFNNIIINKNSIIARLWQIAILRRVGKNIVCGRIWYDRTHFNHC